MALETLTYQPLTQEEFSPVLTTPLFVKELLSVREEELLNNLRESSKETYNHLLRTSLIADDLGKKYFRDPYERARTTKGTLLHDIGKVEGDFSGKCDPTQH